MFVKTYFAAAAILIGALTATLGIQEKREIQEGPTPFMLRKLEYSKNIVHGLAIEDYNLISKNAQALMLLSQEADWNIISTPEYLKSSSEFRDSAQRLREMGNEKNVDGATLAYFEVTLNCVRCHKQIRGHANPKRLNK